MELYSVVEQILEDEYPLLWDTDFFDNADSEQICFTMKDYHRKGGLATFISNVRLPGEDVSDQQKRKQ